MHLLCCYSEDQNAGTGHSPARESQASFTNSKGAGSEGPLQGIALSSIVILKLDLMCYGFI